MNKAGLNGQPYFLRYTMKKFISTIAAFLMLTANVNAAVYQPGVSAAKVLGPAGKDVTTLSYSAASMCLVGMPGMEIFIPNTASVRVHLAYPFPTDAATALANFPSISLKKDGVELGTPTWTYDNGFWLSYPDSLIYNGSLVLNIKHLAGTPPHFDPALGHIAEIEVSTMC